MTKTLLIAAAIILLTYVVVCAAVYFRQDQLLYFPTPESHPPGLTALRLPLGDVTLKIWQVHPNARPALIYFGGNAEDVAADLPDFDAGFPDHAIYLVNYRGYGGSTGWPSETALTSDAEAVYDWVHARHEHISVMGRSLGSGVATALATRRPVERLILITPYDSIESVAADHFSWLPVRWLIKDRYDSLHRIAHVRAPVLAVVAENDEVVFRARSDALIAAMPSTIRHSVVIERATHNDISAFPSYFPILRRFLAAP